MFRLCRNSSGQLHAPVHRVLRNALAEDAGKVVFHARFADGKLRGKLARGVLPCKIVHHALLDAPGDLVRMEDGRIADCYPMDADGLQKIRDFFRAADGEPRAAALASSSRN